MTCNVTFLNSILVRLGRWDGANKWLFEMENRLRLRRFPETTRSINQRLTHWFFETPEMECGTCWWQSMNLNFSIHLWALLPWRGYYQFAYLCWIPIRKLPCGYRHSWYCCRLSRSTATFCMCSNWLTRSRAQVGKLLVPSRPFTYPHCKNNFHRFQYHFSYLCCQPSQSITICTKMTVD